MKTWILFYLVLFTMFTVPAQQGFVSKVHAIGTITWDGSNGTNWSDPQNWDLNRTPLPNDDIVIPSGSITLDTDFHLVGTLTVQNGASLTLDSELNVQPSGIITNDGAIINNNSLDNYGTIDNNNSFTNQDTLSNYSVINNHGTFTNNFSMDNISGSGEITNTSIFNTNHTFSNNNNFFNLGGTLTISGQFNNDFYLLNDSGIVNNVGSIHNTGIIENQHGSWNNSGTINNEGTIDNRDSFLNNSGAIINNTGDMINTGTFTNTGTINILNCAATISGISGGTITNTCGGDTNPPVINTPGDLFVQDAGAPNEIVAFTVTATDDFDGLITAVTCNPPSGSTFPPGDTVVNCSATDLAGNTGYGSFTVTVRDTIPPSVTISSPTSGSITNDSTPTVTGSTEPNLTVTVKIDGITVGTTTANSLGAWSFTPSTPLSNGPHTVNASTTDVSGNPGTSSTIPFTVDTILPVPTVTTTSSSPTNVSPIPFTVTFSEPVTGFIGTDVTVTGGTLGGFGGSGTTYTFSVTPSGVGTVTVLVNAGVATDLAGNPNVASTPASIVYNNVGPTVTISSPISGSTTTNPRPPISGTVSIPNLVVTVKIDGITVGTTTANSLGAWSFTPSTPLSNGPHTVNASTTDVSGNPGTSSTIPFTVDTILPVPTVTTTSSSPTNVSPIPFTVTFSEPVTGFIGTDVTVTGGTLGGFGGSGTTYTFSVTPSGVGTVTVLVNAGVATDLAGNPNVASTPAAVIFDNTVLPPPVITSPASGTVTSNTTPTISGTSGTPNGIVEVFLDNVKVGETTANASGAWLFVMPILSDGTHTIKADIKDGLGHTSAFSNQVSITIDTVPPNPPPILTPSNGATITNTTPLISGTGEAGTTIKVYENITTLIGTAIVSPSGTWSFTPTIPMSNGPHSIIATATDSAGNVSGYLAPTTFTIAAPTNIVLSGIIRDFKISHPDFEENKIFNDLGIVKTALGADKEPAYNGNPTTGTLTTSGLVNYNQWYNHVNTINDCTTYDITLTQSVSNPSLFTYNNTAFFPIDGQLFGNEGKPHNYHFTYQTSAKFTYQLGQNQVITLSGDDDIWVFINGNRVLDLGGVHPVQSSSINLDTLGLTSGQTYDFVLFFAERQTTQSDLAITTNVQLVPVSPGQCKAVDAVADEATTTTSTPVTINVLSNDTPSGLTINSISIPTSGTASLSGTSIIYTPAPGFTGTAFFTYEAKNESGATDSTTVKITVNNPVQLYCGLPESAYSNVMRGTNGNDNLVGTQGNDLIIGNGGDDKVEALKGNDCIYGGDGNDRLNGNHGDDTIYGGNGNDDIYGNEGNDSLYGEAGNDKLYGNEGNDLIDGGVDTDTCEGHAGTNTILQCESAPSGNQLDRTVSKSSDDAEEDTDKKIKLTDVDLDMNEQNYVGVKFDNISVPRGVTITTAYIQFTTEDAEGDTGSATVKIYGQDSSNAQSFSSSKGNISSRPHTSNYVSWTVPNWVSGNDAGAAQKTPELKSLVQGIVNKGDWNSGNSIAFLIKRSDGGNDRDAFSYDGSTTKAPKLHIEYSAP